ncbi:MAG: DNA-processing protein DprA [Lachnospiraceae bacterium]|nr:DNA-processing protein DprA [Lachnospiraceae bacterium]
MTTKNIEEQKKYEYWLYQTNPLRRSRMIRLTERGISPKDLYEMKEEELKKLWRSICQNGQESVTERDIVLILESRRTFDLQGEYAKLQEKGITFVSVLHEDYAYKLRNIPDPPFAYFKRTDNTKNRPDQPTIAIIGARNCSGYGKEIAKRLGMRCADLGMTVVSGLAAGIDSIAQEAANQAGGFVQAVLGSGVDICYPAQNRSLYDAVLKNGEILSEYLPGTAPMACNFPPRNRIISGLSDALIVVEARQKSGTSITVNMALEQGKDVYAIPGRITDPMSLGCNYMISQGAGIITDIEEGLLEIRQMILERTAHADKCNISQDGMGLHNMNERKNPYEKDDLKGRLYACMDYMPKTMQQLYEEIGNANIAEIMTALLQMELDGAVVEKGGAYSL